MKLNCNDALFCCFFWGPRASSPNTGAHCFGSWNSKNWCSSTIVGLSVLKRKINESWLTFPWYQKQILENSKQKITVKTNINLATYIFLISFSFKKKITHQFSFRLWKWYWRLRRKSGCLSTCEGDQFSIDTGYILFIY